MITSFLCSTRRLAFSITISATCTWRVAGSSKVDETTSPRIERCISVTSSGRSSISSTITTDSGWLDVIACAMCCSITVLPLFGGATIRPRWPLPIGAMMSMIRPVMFSSRLDVPLELHHLVRVQRDQVLEEDLVLGVLRRLAVDLVDLHQREIALAVLRRADFAFDGVAGVQVEAADLRRRDVDVVRAGQVRSLRRPQEAEAVRQHLQHAVAEDLLAPLRLALEDGEHQFLFAEPVGALDLQGERHLDQL